MAYLVTDGTQGHPFTIDQAYHFLSTDMIAFGYPDVLFDPKDAFASLATQQAEHRSDVVLGVFPLRPDQSWDVLEFSASGQIQTISSQGPARDNIERWGWAIALWTPIFSAFMHRYLAELVSCGNTMDPTGHEITQDDVFQAAIDGGLQVDHVFFPEGFVLDIGTPEDLLVAQRRALSVSSILP